MQLLFLPVCWYWSTLFSMDLMVPMYLSRFVAWCWLLDVVGMILDVDRLEWLEPSIGWLFGYVGTPGCVPRPMAHSSSKVTLLTSRLLMEWYTSAVGFDMNTWHCVVTGKCTFHWHVIRLEGPWTLDRSRGDFSKKQTMKDVARTISRDVTKK